MDKPLPADDARREKGPDRSFLLLVYAPLIWILAIHVGTRIMWFFGIK